MTTPVYKLTDEEISDKASTIIISKLEKSDTITAREGEILRSCLGRYKVARNTVEGTRKWAQEAFDEQKRLTALLKERWEAGWQGDPQ